MALHNYTRENFALLGVPSKLQENYKVHFHIASEIKMWLEENQAYRRFSPSARQRATAKIILLIAFRMHCSKCAAELRNISFSKDLSG